MDQICKWSKVICKVLTVFFWLTAAVTGLAVIAVIAVLIVKDPSALRDLQLTLGNYKLTLRQSYTAEQFMALWLVTLPNLIVAGLSACYGIKVLQRIFRPMSEGRPFDGSVGAALKKLACTVLAFGVISTILQAVTNNIFYKTFDIPSLFAADKVSSCTLSIISDGSFLVWFVLLLLLSYVFRYGEKLQQLSDETL